MVKTTIIAKAKGVAFNAARVFKRGLLLAKDKSPWFLAIGAAIGVITSVIIAIKQVPKAKQNLDDAYEKYGDSIRVIDKIRAVAVPFIPTIISVVLTIVCLFTGIYISDTRFHKAVKMAAAAQSMVQEYEGKLVEKLGDTTAEVVKREITENAVKKESENGDKKQNTVVLDNENNVLYFDRVSGRRFSSNPVAIGQAINDINSEIIHRINWGSGGWLSLNEAYELMGLDDIGVGYDLGWDVERVRELRLCTTGIVIDNIPHVAINFDIPPRTRR